MKGYKQRLRGGGARPPLVPPLATALRNTLMHFNYLPFKKASMSKCSSLRPEPLGFKMPLPLLKSLSTAALEGKEDLYRTNSFLSAASAKELYHLSFSLVLLIETLLSFFQHHLFLVHIG